MKKKVSVIVPIFNAYKYLSRCIESLLCQTLKDVEIILVDDGSNDGSENLCDEYSRMCGNVIVIHQSNRGISAARREGIKRANGEYFCFVDADDYISERMCEELYNYARRSGARLVIFDLNEIKGVDLSVKKGFKGTELNRKNFYLDMTPGYLCNKFFHRSLADDFLSIELDTCQAEDLLCILPCISNLKDDNDLMYVDKPYYYYFRREDSDSGDDRFVENYKILEYLNVMDYILSHHNSQYSAYIAFYILNTMYWGLSNPKRKCFMALYLEFIRLKLLPLITGRQMFAKFNNLQKYITLEIIPNRIVVSLLEDDSDVYKIARDSWKKYAPDCEIIEITMEDIVDNNYPYCVVRAYEKGDKQFVLDYLKLKYIAENGGIAIDGDMILVKPLGEIRVNKVFFGYYEQSEISSKVLGGVAQNDVLVELVQSYNEDSIFNDKLLPLHDRIQILLEGKYGLKPKGIECYLKGDIIKIYGENILSHRYDENCVFKNYNELDIQAERKNLYVIPHYINNETKCIEINKDLKFKNNELEEKNKWLEERLENAEKAYLNTVNSTSWKMTFPVRKILDKIRGL